jgi:hypothetical protein
MWVKLGLVFGMIALVFAGILYVDRAAYNRGYNAAYVSQAAVITKYQGHLRSLVEGLSKWQELQQESLNAKLNAIKRAQGYCLDASIPSTFLNIMRDSSGTHS